MEDKGHLVLGRYCGESIMIGDDVKVLVKNVQRNGMVRLEVEAPKNKAVDRLEIWEKKRREMDGHNE